MICVMWIYICVYGYICVCVIYVCIGYICVCVIYVCIYNCVLYMSSLMGIYFAIHMYVQFFVNTHVYMCIVFVKAGLEFLCVIIRCRERKSDMAGGRQVRGVWGGYD